MNTYVFCLVRLWAYGLYLAEPKLAPVRNMQVEIDAPNEHEAKRKVKELYPDYSIRTIRSHATPSYAQSPEVSPSRPAQSCAA